MRTGERIIFTAEEFDAARPDLPDGGRWTELEAGHVVALAPPDGLHGTVVLNLGKALAGFARPEAGGYACFELGLIVARNPDSVWCPAVSYFLGGNAFAEADHTLTDTRPALVAEVASTNDRRRKMADRIAAWLKWGVNLVWLLDPATREAHLFQPQRTPQKLRESQILHGGSVLPGFQTPVAELFREPGWYKSPAGMK